MNKNLPVHIATLVDKNEDFIEFQYKTLKKFIKHPFDFTVFNNSTDNNRRQVINQICTNLNIKSIDLPTNNFSLGSDPSKIVEESLNYLWENYIKNWFGILFWMDSDYFLINNLDIRETMKDCDILYYPRYTILPVFKGEYIYTGIFCFNLDNIDKNIRFNIDHIENKSTDVGGSTYYFLKDKNYSKKYLLSYLIQDAKDNIFEIGINGCCQLKFIDNKLTRCDLPITNRIFPFEKPKKEYFKNFLYDYKKHLKIAILYDFPHPYCFELIKLAEEKNFIFFHFRSANYHTMYNNRLFMYDKKNAVKRMIYDLIDN